MPKHSWTFVVVAGFFLLNAPAGAADVAAGRASAETKCGQCHEASDWEGEGAGSLESLIRDIVAGKVSHRTRLQLSSDEIRNIAAYWGQGAK